MPEPILISWSRTDCQFAPAAPMKTLTLNGLVAATLTPLDESGSPAFEPVSKMVDDLIAQGVGGLYVCGSTGEGVSLRSEERVEVTEAFVRAAAGRVPVVAQVGHNSLSEAADLAAHAERAGVDAISATCPSYFKIDKLANLVDCMAEIAQAAPDLPFYYYHIPALTGSSVDAAEFLQLGRQEIPNLRGLKYTDTKLFEFQRCLECGDGAFDVLWGCDEMLLGALATGANAAIGSTYNIAAPLYRQIIDAFDLGDVRKARRWQARSVQLVQTLKRYPFHAALKAVLGLRGHAMGGCRLPLQGISPSQIDALTADLKAIGFFEWWQHHEVSGRGTST